MESILHNFAYSIGYLKELIADLSPEQMVAQVQGMKNHAAWTIGHLAFSCQALAGELGRDRWLPENWGNRFGMGSNPTNDAEAYETKAELLQILDDAVKRIENAVIELSENELKRPLPDENYRKDLPSIRHAISQILVAHTAYHVGQLVVWRRLTGNRAIPRPFL